MPRMNPLTATEGGKVTFRGEADTALPGELALASTVFTKDTVEYTIDEVFLSVGNPQVKLVEDERGWSCDMFADVVAAPEPPPEEGGGA